MRFPSSSETLLPLNTTLMQLEGGMVYLASPAAHGCPDAVCSMSLDAVIFQYSKPVTTVRKYDFLD